MKMRVLFVIASVVLTISLVGCSNSSDLQEASLDDPPDEPQIAKDLVAQGINVYMLNLNDEYLDVSNVEILRRKTNISDDEVYISVQFENEIYCVDAEYTLFYSYYDVGGWHLDDYAMTFYQSSAKKSPYDEDTFISFACQSFSDCTILNHDYGVNDAGEYYDYITFLGVYNCNYSTANVTGQYSAVFSNDIWHEECYFDDVEMNFEKMYGIWQYIHDNGDYVYFDLINIDIYDSDNSEITYSYSTSAWNWLNVYSANNTAFVSPATTKRVILTWETITLMGIDVQMPDGISATIQLGNRSQTSNNTGYLSLDKDSGGQLSYFDNPSTATTVAMQKVN